jgi:hypothetical protein
MSRGYRWYDGIKSAAREGGWGRFALSCVSLAALLIGEAFASLLIRQSKRDGRRRGP